MRLTITGKSGSLNQFVRKVKNTKGEVVCYPKVKGSRNVDNYNHWAWLLTWKDKIDGQFKSRSMSVTPKHVAEVKRMILASVDINEIQAFLKQ
jgi:hypothetical protein